MLPPELSWLPPHPDLSGALRALEQSDQSEAWSRLFSIANTRLDLVATLRVDRQWLKKFDREPPTGLPTKPVRLAVLGSSTVNHLHPGIRVGALRRGLWTTIYESDYGQYAQELFDAKSPLKRWKPTTILFAEDSRHLLGGIEMITSGRDGVAFLESRTKAIVDCWRVAKKELGCQVIQQTALPLFYPLLGNNEHRFAGSGAGIVAQFNANLRRLADDEGVDILALDDRAAIDGVHAWYDPVLWYKAKQEIHPAATPFYGDLVGRLLAAQQGLSRKCVVLDLDNTLWGGVIGDDGLDGIVLGQGSALGEAFLSFQRYLRGLSGRGIVLAVCSKNDEANALEPFEKHPEMVLRRSDIACFAASWQDKPSLIRDIAKQLNVGIDSLVFVDDNPFERNIVRRELPMVAVPELPPDPVFYPRIIADAGYFEGLHLTSADLERSGQYQSNLKREALKASATDIEGYLKSLDMKLHWSRFRQIDLKRIVQLFNKTNQFNLTTRRYTEKDVVAFMETSSVLSVQARLVDAFGDNGIILLVVGCFIDNTGSMEILSWLMSCRVLGRQVERATLNVVVEEAKRLGARRLIGRYRPTAKNGMVRSLYPGLGFTPINVSDGDGECWELNLDGYEPYPTFVDTVEV